MVCSWTAMVILAARLPDGAAKDLAGFLPACATMLRRLRTDPRVPGRAKAAVAFAGLWVLSPIDLIPEFLPVIGPLDDIVVVALALRYAGRSVPRGHPRSVAGGPSPDRPPPRRTEIRSGADLTMDQNLYLNINRFAARSASAHPPRHRLRHHRRRSSR